MFFDVRKTAFFAMKLWLLQHNSFWKGVAISLNMLKSTHPRTLTKSHPASVQLPLSDLAKCCSNDVFDDYAILCLVHNVFQVKNPGVFWNFNEVI